MELSSCYMPHCFRCFDVNCIHIQRETACSISIDAIEVIYKSLQRSESATYSLARNGIFPLSLTLKTEINDHRSILVENTIFPFISNLLKAPRHSHPASW